MRRAALACLSPSALLLAGCIPWSSLYHGTCGDGRVEADEECDDGNTDDTDACPSTCRWARCGDGFVRRSVEECDGVDAGSGGACSAACLSCGGPASFLRSDNGHCYTYDADKKTVIAAATTCAAGSASLLTYPMYFDPDTVYDGFLMSHPATVWLGLYRDKAGYFVWTTTGETPRRFGERLASSASPNDCVTQSPPLNGGGAPSTVWTAVPCTDTAAFVCERTPVVLRPVDNHGYRAFYDRVNWQAAVDTCAGAGGHLVTLRDASENDFVALLGKVDFWIGANDLQTNRTFLWVTGEPFDYVNFSPQDGNGDGTNHCALLSALDNQWYDRRCSDKNAFVCEFE